MSSNNKHLETKEENYSYNECLEAAEKGNLDIVRKCIWGEWQMLADYLFLIAANNGHEDVCLFLCSWIEKPNSALHRAISNGMYNLAKEVIENNEVKTNKLSEGDVRKLVDLGLERSQFTHDVSFLDK